MHRVPFRNVIPLEEIIAETFGTGVGKKVLQTYERMVQAKPEFEILLDLPKAEIEKLGNSEIAEAVIRMREGKVEIEAGYDGIFGKVHIYGDRKTPRTFARKSQTALF